MNEVNEGKEAELAVGELEVVVGVRPLLRLLLDRIDRRLLKYSL